MPWLEKAFTAKADPSGSFLFEEKALKLDLPFSVRLLRYRVVTSTGCQKRYHETSIKVVESNDCGEELPGGYKCEIGPVAIPDCQEIEGPTGCKKSKVKSGYYNLAFRSYGFDPGENVTGKVAVSYSLFLERYPEESISDKRDQWQRRPDWEKVLKGKIREDFNGRFQEAYEWGHKAKCRRFPGDTKKEREDGHWKNDYAQVDPEYSSLELWVNWVEGRVRGSIRCNFYAQAHHKKWKCGVKQWEWQPKTNGHADIEVLADVSSGSAKVSINASWHIGNIGNVPGWMHNAFRGVINNQLKKRFKEKKPVWERKLEDVINNSRPLLYPDDRTVIRASSIVEVLGLESVFENKEYYEELLDEVVIGRTKIEVRYLEDELNQEYIARKINEQIFSTTMDKIDVDADFFFKDLRLVLTPTVQVGQVRIITSPAIKIILASAQFGNEQKDGFVITGKTNIFEGRDGIGDFSAKGKAVVTFIHIYEADKVNDLSLYISDLHIEQAPGASEFVRRQLNNHINVELENNSFRSALAELLNESIDEALGRIKTEKFLTHDQFVEQYRNFVFLEEQIL